MIRIITTPRNATSVALLAALVALTIACGDDDNTCTGATCGGADAAVSDLTAPPDSAAQPDQTAPDLAAPDSAAPYTHENVSVSQVHQWIKAKKVMTLLDVREVSEVTAGHIAGAVNMPWNSGVLQKDFAKLPKDKPLVIYCRSGARSNASATFLEGKGFKPLYDMLGGMLAWQAAKLPVKTGSP